MRYSILLFAFYFILCGCERPNPNPEMSDPIFADLTTRENEAQGNVSSAESEVESAKKDLADVIPQTGARKRALDALNRAQHHLVMANQQKIYLELMKNERLRYTRSGYLRAFREKKPWPDPGEIAQYETNRRLVTASRKWDDRVPKSPELIQAAKNKNPAPAKEAGGESAHGGGEHE